MPHAPARRRAMTKPASIFPHVDAPAPPVKTGWQNRTRTARDMIGQNRSAHNPATAESASAEPCLTWEGKRVAALGQGARGRGVLRKVYGSCRQASYRCPAPGGSCRLQCRPTAGSADALRAAGILSATHPPPRLAASVRVRPRGGMSEQPRVGRPEGPSRRRGIARRQRTPAAPRILSATHRPPYPALALGWCRPAADAVTTSVRRWRRRPRGPPWPSGRLPSRPSRARPWGRTRRGPWPP